MVIGIDASNIRTGGGKKHLEKFVFHCLDEDKNIRFVIVSNNYVNTNFRVLSNVKCITNLLLNYGSLPSMISQLFISTYYFKINKCDFVFAPGGIFLSRFKPFFTMSQNMLPFDSNSTVNFSIFKKIKFHLIKVLQLYSFNRSNGVVFLTEYARRIISNKLSNKVKSIIIPHGISQESHNNYRVKNDHFDILYISDFLPYKNNFNVFIAVKELIDEGIDITLTLIGQKDKVQYGRMKEVLRKNKYLRNKIKVLGKISSNNISKYYKNATLFLFASSCENLPFIMLEAMSFGLPIITTNKSPMKDLVKSSNIFFDSQDINDIKKTILLNMKDDKLVNMSNSNFLESKNYLWKENVSNSLSFFKSNI
ncbi:glycosyltransferase [Flavobacteriaceae bacterium]|nr:glycosyltransferase [Flavobacteriaceae bacterium]